MTDEDYARSLVGTTFEGARVAMAGEIGGPHIVAIVNADGWHMVSAWDGSEPNGNSMLVPPGKDVERALRHVAESFGHPELTDKIEWTT